MCSKITHAYNFGWLCGYNNPNWDRTRLEIEKSFPLYRKTEIDAYLNGMADGRRKDTFCLLGVKLCIKKENDHDDRLKTDS